MYIQKSEVEQYLGVQINSTVDSFLETLIKYAQELIELQTGRVFEAPDPDVDQVRYYNGNGGSQISVDDIRSITSVEIDNVTLEEDVDFVGYPLNAMVNTKPFTSLELISGTFTKGLKNLKITGKFGYSATAPSLIKVACLKLVGGVIKENIGDNDLKEISSESLGEYSVSFRAMDKISNSVDFKTILSQFDEKITPRTRRKLSGYIKAS